METSVIKDPKLELSETSIRIIKRKDIREINLNEIIHLGWQAVETKYSMGGTTDEANIALATQSMLTNEKLMSLYWSSGMFGRFYDTSDKISTPREFYIRLCELTWPSRYTSRKNELDTIGFFEYFGRKFHADGTVVYTDGSKINLHDINFSRMGHHLMATPKQAPKGFFAKIKHKLNGFMLVDMQMDTDAMRQLLIDIVDFDFFTIWGKGFLQNKPSKH